MLLHRDYLRAGRKDGLPAISMKLYTAYTMERVKDVVADTVPKRCSINAVTYCEGRVIFVKHPSLEVTRFGDQWNIQSMIRGIVLASFRSPPTE